MKIIKYLILPVVLIIFAIGLFVSQPPKELYGKEVIYYGKFKSSTQAAILGKNKIAFFDCVEEKTTVTLTTDIVQIVNSHGIINLKPKYLTKENQLFCVKQDGTIVVLIRFIPKDKEINVKNEHLIMVIEDKLLILNPKTECLQNLKN